MERLIIDIESAAKAKELRAVVAELGFVAHVTLLHDVKPAPGAAYATESAFKAELDRRNTELESGAVKGLSIDELEAGVKLLYQDRA